MSALLDFLQRFGEMFVEDTAQFISLVLICLAAGFLIGRRYSTDEVSLSDRKASFWKDRAANKAELKAEAESERERQKRLTRKQKRDARNLP